MGDRAVFRSVGDGAVGGRRAVVGRSVGRLVKRSGRSFLEGAVLVKDELIRLMAAVVEAA